MSLSTYIKMRASRLPHVLASVTPMEESEQFPCKACAGEGVIAMYTQFSPIRKRTDRLKGGDGLPITCVDAMPCPSCSGTGLNQDDYVAYLRGMDKAELEKVAV